VAPPDVDPLLPVCAIAAPPSKITSDAATMIFFISILHSSTRVAAFTAQVSGG
jgi:hypothetical protein